MKCPRCEVENDAGARFCEDCGARLEAACPSCGTPVTPGKKFCRSCGAALTPEPSRFTSPESYIPKHLAEKILTSKAALEGERKQVTVLFADLKGSMELLADRDPEEARKLLDPVLEHMMEAVHRYEGTVNQVMGDGIMALFGAPLAHEDHAVRACYAALRMQESVKRYAEAVLRGFGVPIQIRVGLNSGDVVVRAIGSDLRMDYTAVGQSTHLAARMEQMAQPGTILLTPETLSLAEGFVQVTSRGPVPVKGLTAPIEIFELSGASPVRSRLHAAAARGLTGFVGRDRELQGLHQALERTRASQGQVVGVVGEPGVGKSRLLWEFTHSPRLRDCLLLESGSVSYGKAVAYLPVVGLLKTYFQIDHRDGHRTMREKVTAKMLSLDRTLEPALPAILALLDVPLEDPAWQALDPSERRQQTLDAVKRLLLRETRAHPVVVVFEDLHWIDTETQAVLDSVVESLPTSRLLLIVNYRPEYQHGWGSKTFYMQLRIDPLPAEGADELLRRLLGTDPALQPLMSRLIQSTQGNPFFLEECVRMLVETDQLCGAPNAYRLRGDVPNIQVPASVQAILAARIDRLPAEDKQLLQSASVIGKDVAVWLLQAVAHVADDALRRGLARLQMAEFLYEARLFPDSEYTFKHALTHEVAYGSILHERRRAVHAHVVEVIERLTEERRAEHVEALAHHAFRGEAWDKAVEYCREAAVRAITRSANREAGPFFEQAIAAVARLPETSATLEQAIDLRFDLRSALWPLAERPRILELLREMQPLVERLGDARRLARFNAFMSTSLWSVGRHDEAATAGERALLIADDLGELAHQVPARLRLSQVYHAQGDHRRAVELNRWVVAALPNGLRNERFGSPGIQAVLARVWLGWSLAELGEFTEARTRVDEAVAIAEAADQPYSLIAAYSGVGEVGLVSGDLNYARAALERGVEVCRTYRGDITVFYPLLSSMLGVIFALSGRLSDALQLAELSLKYISTSPVGLPGQPSLSRLPGMHRSQSEVYRLAGQFDHALSICSRGLEMARQARQRADEASLLCALGNVAVDRQPPDVETAVPSYRNAVDLAFELGMRPLVAHCHLGLGKLYRRTGEREPAREHLATATTMYREMDMRFYLEQADAELAELR